MNPRCTVVIPVRDRAALTRQCLDAILSERPRTAVEVIVVDDGSTDSTAELLAGYGGEIDVVTRADSGGFAAACNDGAARAAGELLVFLNNDTLPRAGWLDALVAHADSRPEATVVGAKLLFPNGSVQHAGVTICQDGNPRHLYAGFPANHPAVSRPRPLQAVTAACMLVRRDAFEQAGGYDTAFRNSFEDVDLCLRLGERGHEVHYCPDSVLEHLESASRPRRSKDVERSMSLYRQRWADKARRDDFDLYREDGLLDIQYRESYPIGIWIAPELAALAGAQGRLAGIERLLDERSRQVMDLLRETVRLSARIAELELVREPRVAPNATDAAPAPAHEGGLSFGEAVDRIEAAILSLQRQVAADPGLSGSGTGFGPSPYLSYKELVRTVRDSIERSVPAGAAVLVVSRGDEALVDLEGREGRHFPQDERGRYAGHYPRDAEEAIAHLEQLREQGAAFLVVPADSSWWLDHYAGLASHLESRYETVLDDAGSCRIFSLAGAHDEQGAAPRGTGAGART